MGNNIQNKMTCFFVSRSVRRRRRRCPKGQIPVFYFWCLKKEAREKMSEYIREGSSESLLIPYFIWSYSTIQV